MSDADGIPEPLCMLAAMERPKSRREEYADSTREALLSVGREMFTRDGYQLTRIEDLVQAARMTRGALYPHFPDKQALFEAVVVGLQQEVASKVKASVRKDSDRLRQLGEGMAVFLELCTEPSYRRLVIDEAPAVLGSRRCREIEDATTIGMMIAAMVELKKQGVVDVRNAEMAGRMVAAMICKAALLVGDAPRPAEFKRDAVDLAKRFLESLRAG
jgi:AcrR family transcriptional regulator